MATASQFKVNKNSKFHKLAREAKKDLVTLEPYEFDAVEPSIFIDPPTSIERSLALATLVDNVDTVAIEDLKPMLEALIGDNFPIVWAFLGPEPIDVTLAFVDDLHAFFLAGVDDGAEELPGEEQDS
nr:hypothetical protein [Rhodococcus sp. (in: high G+C Gram-positive bacteria)]